MRHNYKRLTENYFLVEYGMGGFLNPPGDAEHYYSIWGGRNINNPEEMISLRGALKENWIPEAVKFAAKRCLQENRGRLTEEWVRKVYAYFRHCYARTGEDGQLDRSAGNCIVDRGNTLPETHLAYLWIREFFPQYPVRDDLIKGEAVPKGD